MTLLFKRARSLDPSTSHAAADQAQDLARFHGGLIVICLQRFGARGKDGIAELTGLDGSDLPLSIGLRFVEPESKPD